MDDEEDIVEEGPLAIEGGPADPPGAGSAPVDEPAPEAPVPETEALPEFAIRKPGIYQLRPRGLRPAPRPARRRRGRLRNDCPPDRRRESGRPPLKPRLR